MAGAANSAERSRGDAAERGHERLGLILGFVGVLIFSLTLPATRRAVQELPPEFVGLGRAVPAACVGGLMLLLVRARRPHRHELLPLAVTSLGVVLGFPLLSALAMRSVDASHGAVVLAVLPLLTAAAGAVVAGERPSARFWSWAVAGSLSVLAFALLRGRGALAGGDAYLALAAVMAAVGYATGGRLARAMPGLHVIAWALLMALPALLALGLWYRPHVDWQASWTAWGCFLWVALMSQFLGFFFWYRGLALGGIARVGQVQLLQTFLTIGAGALLLGERIDLATLGFAVLTLAFVWLARRERVGGAGGAAAR